MIIITRPSPYGEELTAMCLAANLPAQHQPLFAIKKGKDLSNLQHQLDQLTADDIIIITSPQVIQQLSHLPLAIQFPAQLNYFTVGKQTARLFNQLTDLPISYPTDREDSEGLLTLLSSQSNKKVLILRGNQGRTLLTEQLLHQNCQVTYLECYQRTPIIYHSNDPKFIKMPKVIVITSIDHLNAIEPYYSQQKTSIHLIVSHPRIKLAAEVAGWRKIICAENANNQNLFKTITTLCHNEKSI